MSRIVEPWKTDQGLCPAEDLDAWRGALVAGLGLEDESFQLIAGGSGRGILENGHLFRLADISPPEGRILSREAATSRPRWSEGYGELLSVLLPETECGLRGILGPLYSGWIASRDQAPCGLATREYFQDWANGRLEPSKMQTALRAHEASTQNPHGHAREAFADLRFRPVHVGADGQIGRVAEYSITLDAARAALSVAKPVMLRYDSSAAARRRRNGPAAASFGKLASGPITVSGVIRRHALLPVHRGGWFDFSQIDRAWCAPEDGTVWEESACRDGWRRYFGPDGVLTRRYGQLLVVSGVDLMLTSHARYSGVEAALLEANAETWFWPPHAAIRRSDLQMVHNSDQSLTVRISLPDDRVHVWGGTILESPA